MNHSPYSFQPEHNAEAQWQAFEKSVQTTFAEFFDATGPIVGARAPGRLDVLGGVADYSGSVVLEMPIAQATCVAWQWRDDREIRILSTEAESVGFTPAVTSTLR